MRIIRYNSTVELTGKLDKTKDGGVDGVGGVGGVGGGGDTGREGSGVGGVGGDARCSERMPQGCSRGDARGGGEGGEEREGRRGRGGEGGI